MPPKISQSKNCLDVPIEAQASNDDNTTTNVALCMETTTSKAILPNTSTITVGPATTMKTTLPMVLPCIASISRDIKATALPVVTTSTCIPKPTLDTTLTMVTASTAQSTLHMVSVTSTATTLSVATNAQSAASPTASTHNQWSRIMNKPLGRAEATKLDISNKAESAMSPEAQAAIEPVDSSSQAQETNTNNTDVDSRYYEVMNPEGDEIYNFSHQDIVARKCKVSLEKLSSKDITDIKHYLKPAVPAADSSSSSTTPEPDLEPPKNSRN